MTRDKSKDILMICKNHYDDKYKTTIDALRAYQSEYTGCEEKYITDGNILTFLLDTAKEYFKSIDWYLLIKDRFVHDIDMAATGLLSSVYPQKKIVLDYQYLCKVIVSNLCVLKVRDDNGWIIDLSAYDGVEKVI